MEAWVVMQLVHTYLIANFSGSSHTHSLGSGEVNVARHGADHINPYWEVNENIGINATFTYQLARHAPSCYYNVVVFSIIQTLLLYH